MIGKKIESYEIQEILGRGGMGVVYRARDTKLERDVAIKMMDLHYASDPNFLNRFQSEAKALARLQDPHIVSIFSLLETPDGICIVMEYVKGLTLAKLLQPEVALPVPRVIAIFKQLLMALAHAHKEGVIHRDIKPANIIVGDEDRIKVADFGLAKVKQEFAVTATKGTAGTLYYMSPEQFRGLKEVDNRGDIYSAGMTMYECLAGKLPFGTEDSYFTIAQQVVHGQVPPPETLNTQIPGGLVAIVKRMIACEPQDRYQNAEDVVKDLEEFEKSGWVASSVKGTERVWLAGAAALVVVLVGAYFVFRPAGNPSATEASRAAQVQGDSASKNPRTPQESSPGKSAPAGEMANAAKGAGSPAGDIGHATAGKDAAGSPGDSRARPFEGSRRPSPAGTPASPSGSTPGNTGGTPGGTNATPVDDSVDPLPNLPVDIEPKVLTRAEPDYKGGVTGDVRLLVLVDREGKVQKVRVQSYDSEAFINPAIEAARQSVFSPAVMNNVKVRAWAPLKVRFGAKQDEGQ
jgi:serine/threonine protein kinase